MTLIYVHLRITTHTFNYMFTCGTYQALIGKNMTKVGFTGVYLRHA